MPAAAKRNRYMPGRSARPASFSAPNAGGGSRPAGLPRPASVLGGPPRHRGKQLTRPFASGAVLPATTSATVDPRINSTTRSASALTCASEGPA
jgi:hypothetical protein